MLQHCYYYYYYYYYYYHHHHHHHRGRRYHCSHITAIHFTAVKKVINI